MKFFLVILLSLSSFSCSPKKNTDFSPPLVIVGISPYAYFVKQIAGETIKVHTLIPPGYNPHLYEGSPRQFTGLEKAQLLFGLGEPFEKKILPLLKKQNPSLIYVNLTDNIPIISYETEELHDHEMFDRHIWMSPKLDKKQAEVICEKLIEINPTYADLYQKNLIAFLEKLSRLDKTCREILSPVKNRAILISHPSLGYFCKDYDLIQLSIESEGKSPLPKDLGNLLKLIETYNIHCAFTQPQFDNKATLLIAKKKHLKVQEINPELYDFPENIKNIAEIIAACKVIANE